MAPRALNDRQKEVYRQKIVRAAKELFFTHGIRKVSVENITKLAGISKGAFYLHFTCKEDLVAKILWEIYMELLDEAKAIIQTSPKEEVRERISMFISSFLADPARIFFFTNHEELETFLRTMESEQVKSFHELEKGAFAQLIQLLGKNPQKVNPMVVHNLIHAMYFSSTDVTIMKEALEETLALLRNTLLDYIFDNREKSL